LKQYNGTGADASPSAEALLWTAVGCVEKMTPEYFGAGSRISYLKDPAYLRRVQSVRKGLFHGTA
jgi:hypothetical protein